MIDAYNRDPARAESLFAQALRTGESDRSPTISPATRASPTARALTSEGNYRSRCCRCRSTAASAGWSRCARASRGSSTRRSCACCRRWSSNISFALELMDKQDRLSYLALYDPLTGLPNRALFHERLRRRWKARARPAGGRAGADRPRALQGDQRHARPAGRRPRAAAARQAPAGGRGRHPSRRAPGRQPVRAACSRHQRRGGGRAAHRGGLARRVRARRSQIEGREVRIAAKAGIARVSRRRRRRRRAVAQRRGGAQARQGDRRALPVLRAAR